MKRAPIIALLAIMALTGCTRTQLNAWLHWHATDPDAAIAFAQQPDITEALAAAASSDGPQFAQYLDGRGGCDGIYDEMRHQGATDAVARRFAYHIAPRESGCTPQYVHDRDDWSHSRFGLNGLTAALRANWARWCGADVRSDTKDLTTDVTCALAAYHRMGWAPWS